MEFGDVSEFQSQAHSSALYNQLNQPYNNIVATTMARYYQTTLNASALRGLEHETVLEPVVTLRLHDAR